MDSDLTVRDHFTHKVIISFDVLVELPDFAHAAMHRPRVGCLIVAEEFTWPVEPIAEPYVNEHFAYPDERAASIAKGLILHCCSATADITLLSAVCIDWTIC